RRESQTALAAVALDDLLEPGLVDRNLPAPEGADLGLVLVDAHHLIAVLGKARADDQPYISRTDDGNLHRLCSPAARPRMSCTDHTRRTPYASIRAVRVLLDYRPALRARTGVGEYAHQVTCALAALRRDADDEVVAFSSSWKDRLVPPCPGVTVADARVPVRCLNLLWHHVGWPPVERFAGRVDVAHSITPLLVPARTARQVVTVHDLFFLDHPDATSAEIRRDYPRLVRSHAQRADLVVTPSHHVSALVVERLDVDPGRVLTCPGGAPRWTARPSVPAEGPVIFLGTLEPRKNVHLLLDAWTILAGRGGPVPTLLLAGGPGPDAEAVAARIAQPPL